MTKRLFVLVPAAAVMVGLPTLAFAKDVEITERTLDREAQRLQYDPPQAHLDAAHTGARLDTTWFGGVDGGSGLAIEGGIWDFEDGTLQGWTDYDHTGIPVYFRRVQRSDFDTDGDLGGPFGEVDQDCVIEGNWSVWVGAFAREAVALCWRAGQGYSNGWGMNAAKEFTYGGVNTVTIRFDYFVDSETGFDFTYVYTEVGGSKSAPLNTCDQPDENGFGYSGDVQDFGSAIGTPADPEHEIIEIQTIDLPTGVNPFNIVFNFDSDPLYSDGTDSLGEGVYLNSIWGPFGMDNFDIFGTSLSDTDNFELSAEDWIFYTDPAIGSLMKVAHLDDLDPISDPCACPITTDETNDYVMVMANIDGVLQPHPKKQNAYAFAPPAYTGTGSGVEDRTERLINWNLWADLPSGSGSIGGGVGFRQLISFYPWTCPATGFVGWTVEPAGTGGYSFQNDPACFEALVSRAEFMPAYVESMKVVFEIIADCDDFGWDDCAGADFTNHSPYFDDVRLGLAGLAVNAPAMSVDVPYQDIYPFVNSLTSTAPALAIGYNDNNRSDNDQTNADMADSVAVVAGTQPDTEVYLNFRVYPGPQMDTGAFDTYMTGNGLASNSWLAPSFAKARMDTAEVSTGTVTEMYSSYFWPDGQEGYVTGGGGPTKIIPDLYLTPGTTVEYFFSTNFTSTPGEQNIVPDTTGGFFSEFEILPGYATIDGVDMTPCFLYVDAFNFGAQGPFEEWGLSDYLGSAMDDGGRTHDAWDRYDYIGAGGNSCAPLARESGGNNGMTRYQSMVYYSVVWNTGSSTSEGLRNGDAALLANLLTNDDFNRWNTAKGLWLSGNGMAQILSKPNRPESTSLLGNFARASITSDEAYHVITGDSTFCVRLDPSTGRDFPASSASYSSLRGNGCPNLRTFQILNAETGTDGQGLGNQDYANQDELGEPTTQYASVSNDQFAPGNPANYGVVIDAYSMHYLRTTSDGWTGMDCDTFLTAITTRTADVLSWMNVPTGGNTFKSTAEIVVGVPGTPGAAGRTALHQNSPNPFNPKTTVRYQLGLDAQVKLQIFDVSGRLVRTLVDGAQVAGDYDVTWDGITDAGSKVSSGVYWARMSTSHGFSASTKMVVLK